MQMMSNSLLSCWNCYEKAICLRLPTTHLKSEVPLGYRWFCGEECHGAWVVEKALKVKPSRVLSADPVVGESFGKLCLDSL